VVLNVLKPGQYPVETQNALNVILRYVGLIKVR